MTRILRCARSLLALTLMLAATTLRAGDIREIEVTAREFRLEPAVIEVHRGETVVLQFRNQGVLAHNLSIDALGLKTATIYQGEQDSLRLTPQTTGEIPFRCAIPGHAEAGMKGVIRVVE